LKIMRLSHEDDPPIKHHPKVERIVVPKRPIVEFATEAASELEETIKCLEQWMGKPFAEGARPYQALDVLRDMAATGRFTPQQRGDEGGPRALQLALDLRAIADALPPAKV